MDISVDIQNNYGYITMDIATWMFCMYNMDMSYGCKEWKSYGFYMFLFNGGDIIVKAMAMAISEINGEINGDFSEIREIWL